MMLPTKFRLASLWTILSVSTVSSSFVPRAPLVRVSHNNLVYNGSYLGVKGGSDEGQDLEQTFTPPPPASEIEGGPEVTAVVEPSLVVDIGPPPLLGPNAPPPGFLRKALPSFPWHQLPNYLTYARCLAIPALAILFYQPESHVLSAVLFAIASFTDWLDGYLARRWDITSAFGAFLDPVADKLMVSTALILLAGRYGGLVAIPTAIILAREIAVSALREWMAQRGQRDIVKVGLQGKIKTALTMVALTVLLLVPYPPGSSVLSKMYNPGVALLYLSSLVTITSGSVYFIAAIPLLKGVDSR